MIASPVSWQAGLLLAVLVWGCSGPSLPRGQDRTTDPTARESPAKRAPYTDWVYQLQGYPAGRLDELERSPHRLAVIDLARDAATGYFTPAEITSLRASGKQVLAYFEIGSIESFRPEHHLLLDEAPDLVLNRWDEWPEESFVQYWTRRWWRAVVRPRLERALRTGYDGVYLDTLLAYEEIPPELAGGRSRRQLGREMVDLLVRISRYAKSRRPGFWVVPQNSPELRRHPGYLDAIDGIGLEELFYRATDQPCTDDWCLENLQEARRIRAAGKVVLAVDYATDPRLASRACACYRREGFAGYVADVALDRVNPPCHNERQPS